MGGEAGADGPRGRVKSLGLVFEDESKGSYSSGETVAGHVLLEAAEPVALRGLRLEAQGRATSAWGSSAGARVCIGGGSPAASSEVEYLNLRLSLLEAPAGEHGDPQGRREGARPWVVGGTEGSFWKGSHLLSRVKGRKLSLCSYRAPRKRPDPFVLVCL